MMRILICIAYFCTAYLVFTTSVAALNHSPISQPEKTNPCEGTWAVSGCDAFNPPRYETGKVRSPSGQFSVDGTTYNLFFNNGSTPPIPLNIIFTRTLTEIVWAPNSMSFAVNTSEGGNVGTFETAIYTINKTLKIKRIKIDPKVHMHMMRFQRCDPLEPERPNLGVSAWLANGSEILLVAEVPPHSSCKNMGALLGFRISATTGRLIDKIPEPVLRTKYKHLLGARFVGYRDSGK
jgi:hypothetical protein